MPTNENHWHLDKRVPIAIIVSLAVQSAAIIWWAATMEARVTAIEAAMLAGADTSERLTRIEVILERVERRLDQQEDRS